MAAKINLEFRESTVELIDHMGDDRRAASAARASFLADDLDSALSERDKKLIGFLMREKHTSPFEHSVVTFRIEAPLPVVAQIMRHRTFSYNQASRRYTSENIEFFEVKEWRWQGEKNLQCSGGAYGESGQNMFNKAYKDHCLDCFKQYQWALDNKCSREQARFFLPQGLMARFWMTGNLHNYLKFLILRDDEHAQDECREVARLIKAHLQTLFPETMALFEGLRGEG